jgi:hypothetical protein
MICPLCRGNRIEVKGLNAFDVTRGAEFLGQSWMTNAYIKINTDNTVNGWSNWPWNLGAGSQEYYWSSWPVKVGPVLISCCYTSCLHVWLASTAIDWITLYYTCVLQ